MYLLYIDESGRPSGTSTTHLVVAGLAIHEDDTLPFARSIRAVQRRWVGPAKADLELHATDIWRGRHAWAPVPEENRYGLVRAMFRHLATWRSTAGREPRYFGAVVHKPSFPATAVERAHEELFARFDGYLRRLPVPPLTPSPASSHKALNRPASPACSPS